MMFNSTLNSVALLTTQKLRVLALGFCIIFSWTIFGQANYNLVKNYSAEEYKICPFSVFSLNECKDWFTPFWTSSPDFFHSCATNTNYGVPSNFYGGQASKTGSGYLGIAIYLENFSNNNKEYIEGKLYQTLKPNKMYCLTFYTSLSETSRIACANIGFLFTKDSLINHAVPGLSQFLNGPAAYESTNIITDSLGWVKIQTTYLATGDENFILIGNFNSNGNTIKQVIKPLTGDPNKDYAYYYIDDVSVIEINPAKAYPVKSITVCANTTFTLGTDSTSEATYQWQPTTGLSCTNCPNPVVTVISSQKYILTKQQCSATTKDSVTITIYTPTLTANAGPFKNICLNDTIKLGVNDTTAYTSYTWQPFVGLSCTNCPQPVTMPLASITYTLNKKECSFNTSDTVTVFVEPCEVIIPDIFTPNNDNINDEWKIKFPSGFKLKTVAVYNRWGTLVYSIDDEVLNSANSKIKIVRWDGRTTSGLECSEGVYFYVIHYTDKNAILHKQKGNLTLMR